MARAERVPPAEYEVVLTMNRAEAETLRFILFRIGGSAELSARKHTDAIRDALNNAGVILRQFRTDGAEPDRIYFAPEQS